MAKRTKRARVFQRCPHCNLPLRTSLVVHLSTCHIAKLSEKRPLPGHPASQPKAKRTALKQTVSSSAVATLLSSDAHGASSEAAPTDHLCPPASIHDLARASSPDFHSPDDIPCDSSPPAAPAQSLPDATPSPAPPAEDTDAEFMQRYLPYIDPDANDFFCPSNFDEGKMQFVEPLPPFREKLSRHLLAQIDLFRLLHRSGCPLYLYNDIVSWIRHYSGEGPNHVFRGDLWLRRQPLIEKVSQIFKTDVLVPTPTIVKCPRRNVTVSVNSFIHSTMSLLRDKRLTNRDAIVKDYDIWTGTCGSQFWDPATVDLENSTTLPTPMDPSAPVSGISSSYFFQGSVSRLCTEPHHVPVPIIMGYDESNMTMLGENSCAPVIYSLGFTTASTRRKNYAWRTLGLMPNLSAGVGVTDDMSSDEKQLEHHLCLAEILRELKEVCHSGGFKT